MYAVHWSNSRKLRKLFFGNNWLWNSDKWKCLSLEKNSLKRRRERRKWLRGCTSGAAKPTGQTSSALHINIVLFTDHITIAIAKQTDTFLCGVQLLPDLLSSVHDASTSNGSIKTFTKVASFWTYQPSFQPINHQPIVLQPQTKRPLIHYWYS